MVLTPTCLWLVTADLVLALDDRIGFPIDSYVNGTQTWLADAASAPTAAGALNAPVTLEWRLHPVAAYEPPRGLSHYDVWDHAVAAIRTDGDPSSLTMGKEQRSLDSLWDGLECFPAYGDELEPATLAMQASVQLGLTPDDAGLVDHGRIGDEWERTHRRRSIVAMVREELRSERKRRRYPAP